MNVYSETLDPSEVKDFTQDWSNQLGATETLSGSPTVVFVNAAGTTSPVAASSTGAVSRVWLTGGTHGQQCTFLVRVSTSEARTLEQAFAVNVVDNSLGETAQTEVERITAELVSVKAMRSKVAAGEAIEELWRDGRRVRKVLPSLSELTAHIAVLERELAEALAAEAGSNKRRPIRLAWRN